MDMRALIDMVAEAAKTIDDIEIDEGFEDIVERAPPGRKAKRFIDKHSDEFRDRYGDAWKRVLYATAWKKFS